MFNPSGCFPRTTGISSSLRGLVKESIQHCALFGNSVRFISLFHQQAVFIIVLLLQRGTSLGSRQDRWGTFIFSHCFIQASGTLGVPRSIPFWHLASLLQPNPGSTAAIFNLHGIYQLVTKILWHTKKIHFLLIKKYILQNIQLYKKF